MNDLTFAVVVIAALCGLLVHLGYRIGILGGRWTICSEVAAGLAMAGYLIFVWDRPVLTRFLPTSALIVLGNWLPLWGSFFVGLALSEQSSSRIRRGILASVAMVFVSWSTIAPVSGDAPKCRSASSSQALQFQTTPHTCSPACAASLLRLHGIEATEAELTELCLTREGTHWMGVFRGLMLKTRDTAWTVAVEEFSSETILAPHSEPAILALNFDTTLFLEDYEHGFQADTGHSVVSMGTSGRNRVAIFDPSPDFGIEHWGDEMFRNVTDGVILRLVPRDPDSQQVLTVQRRMLVERLHSGYAIR
ncbi:MAG: hypothetical protein R3C49_27720 [Planctomycetaceae bacterium]